MSTLTWVGQVPGRPDSSLSGHPKQGVYQGKRGEKTHLPLTSGRPGITKPEPINTAAGKGTL